MVNVIDSLNITGMIKLLYEQFEKYTTELKQVEDEIIIKYRVNEDYSMELRQALELKTLQEACLKMIIEYSTTKEQQHE
jgi:hypothetical protein